MFLGQILRKRLQSAIPEYYQWRYWNRIAKDMRIQVKENKEEINSYCKPGIALSFDDSFRVEHWYKYRNQIFGFHDVKATFNINAFHHFEGQREHTQKEIDQLLELQADGHEIAHHGFKHRRSVHYSKNFGMEGWIENDIKPLFKWMEKQSHSKTGDGFRRPVTYAFPHFVYNEDHVKEISPRYFKVVRGHYRDDNMTPFNHIGFAPSISIDSQFLKDGKSIKKIMKIAKQSGKNLILTCHSILPMNVNWYAFGWGNEAKAASQWRITPETLQKIIHFAGKLDMPFYTTAELAGVATFIDGNFEKCVREQLQNPNSKWISIEELGLIKALDISNSNVSNLDGIQYLSNLETINIGHNAIADLRLLKRLPKLNNIKINSELVKKEA